MAKIGHGVLTWDGEERRSQRYGFFALVSETFEGERVTQADLDLKALDKLLGKRVRITAEVVAARKSGHVGDKFLGIQPTMPEVGTKLDLGVGILTTKDAGQAVVYGLTPQDGRDTFWLDPRQLYQLHDQTVDIFIEETTDAFSEPPSIQPSKEGVLALEEGYMQVVGRVPRRVAPHVEKLGGGMFIMGGPTPPGRRVKVLEYEDDDSS